MEPLIRAARSGVPGRGEDGMNGRAKPSGSGKVRWFAAVPKPGAARTRRREGRKRAQINRTAPANIGLVVEPAASSDDDVVPFGPRAECRSLALHVESVTRKHVSKRRVANLVSELGYFHDHQGRYILCAWLWVLMMRPRFSFRTGIGETLRPGSMRPNRSYTQQSAT